ncbi:MAG: glycosyltransferase family 2 protein [Microscillaceae bacterium]|nr:glycosyltransferase family 2 protein [Microscillaceae bacterium]MDW8461021.1 glycosyltransferase family 2 protein [Cytophagales bacterium]
MLSLLMISISAVIITKNEERNIGRCIDSLQGVADEIIVVDSFSTDKTAEICREKGVIFLQTEWKGFAATKNWGNAQAKHDFILSLDADEALSPALQKALLQIKRNSQADGYILNRITNYCGNWIRYGHWYPDKHLRLWNKQKGEWQGYIHEKVVMLPSAKIVEIKNADLEHYSFPTISSHITKIDFFTTMTAQNDFRKGKKAAWWRIIFSPIWLFLVSYIFRLGFLEGWQGLAIAVISAFSTFVKYLKIKEMHQKQS